MILSKGNSKRFCVLLTLILIFGVMLFSSAGCSRGADILIEGLVSSGDASQTGKMIRINEVMTRNSYFAPLPDGTCCDWVELYNPLDESVDIKGFAFSDDTRNARKWVVPVEKVIAPGEYLVVYMSGFDGVDEYGNLHTSFKLSSAGETLLFSTSFSQLIQVVDIPQFTMENISYGIDERTGNSDFLWMAEPTPGRAASGDTAKNAGQLEFKTNGVLISEYMTDNTFTVYDHDGEYSDWLELYNPTDEDISLTGCSLSDKGRDGSKWFFPDNTVIKAGEYLLVFCSGKQMTDDGELHASFKLGQADTSLVVFSPSGMPMITLDVEALPENVSCGIVQDGEEWMLFSQSTPGRANDTYAYSKDSIIQGTPASDVVISEALAVSSNMKGDKYTCDYIELCNVSAHEVNLSGYGLSDGIESEPFVFPKIILQPKEYIVVQCTGKNNTDPQSLSAAFKISQGGESIYLFDPDGYVADILKTGKQVYGVTRGRLVEDMSQIYYFNSATPGNANSSNASVLGYAPQPSFSINGGIVEKGTNLKISYPEGCKVHYTTDGSRPDQNSNVYDPEKGITIDSSVSIRAVGVAEGMLESQIITATFLVDVEHDLPVVCMSSDPAGLFSDETGIYSSAKGYLAGKEEPNYKSEEERECAIEYYVDGKRAVAFNSGVRIFGAGSRTYAQKSFALLLRERYGANSVTFPFFADNITTTFSSLVLRQAGQECRFSKIRDELVARVVKNQVKCDMMDETPVVLYINGEYWGLYYIREKLNEDYLFSKYGYEKDEIEIIKSEYTAISGAYEPYRDLRRFAAANDLSIEENYRFMCEQINMESLIDFWICETFFANNDTSNIRVYRSTKPGEKWAWMLFDLDNACYPYMLRTNSIYEHLLDPEGHGIYDECSNTIIRKLLENEQFKSDFVSRYCYHLKYTFAPERTTALMDELVNEIKSEMGNQYDRWGSPSDAVWQKHISDIQNFLNNRHKYVFEHIKSDFNLTDKQFEEIYKSV